METNHDFSVHAEWIDEHLSKFFKDDEIVVFHELVSPDIHLDVYLINAEQLDFQVLLTSGMSTKAMNMGEDLQDREDLKFAELMLLLPKNISFEKTQPTGQNGWIIGMLKQTARFPHEYETWLGIGHTIQADADMEPYADQTNFRGCLILPSVTFEEDFTEIRKDNRLINIYSLCPLYKEELEFKIKNGYNAFLDVLINKDANELFDNERASFV